jgi:RHS repeat-associated protein
MKHFAATFVTRAFNRSKTPSYWRYFLIVFAASPAIYGFADANRTTQNIQPAADLLNFSAAPTVEEIYRAHLFAEPLVPVGGTPTAKENTELAAALVGYSKRSGPDDFTSLTGFLHRHPQSPWTAALLTDLGLEYYNTAHYSQALDTWSNAWSLAGRATDAKSAALVSRAFAELIKMDSRLGRMDEIERLLNSIGNQPLPGPAGQGVTDAREALWNMKNRPEISFRCGPLALRSIRIALNMDGSSDAEILKTASSQRGCSLPQVAELSGKIGLNYQMAFRNSGDFIVPSVVHWKVGHYAAMVRKAGTLYELQDPTFGNTTWATKDALEAETSGYFLVASGPLPRGWRTVNKEEGATVWGKGMTSGNDPQRIARNDLATGGGCLAIGMAVARVHLMDVNLNLTDHPLGYNPPVGPPVWFGLRYNRRDGFQPANFTYGNLGSQWTADWFTYITDNPTNPLANVNLYVGGGGQRTYIGFNTNSQSFAYQQYDQNLLTRTGPASYQLLYRDGSKMIFSQSDGSAGSSRNIFLTQQIDPQGNALTFQYNTNLCLVSVADAIGQVTTLTYGLASTNIGSGINQTTLQADPYKLTKVTDPFGRTALFNYQPTVVALNYTFFQGQRNGTNPIYAWGLASVTDEIGITSQFGYESFETPINQFFSTVASFVNSLTTPYGTTSFISVDNGNIRSLDINYPDGSRERVEYNQGITNLPMSDPPQSVPVGMSTDNDGLQFRSSYHWDRKASAVAYGDYSKARLYQWMHTDTLGLTAGTLETAKMPLEGRVWFDYAGQSTPSITSSNTLPAHIGRVLDDGSTRLYTYGYNLFGNLTNLVDPIGRTLTFIYDTNGIDLLEVRQTRLGKNELLAKMTYNSQHCALTSTGPSGQTTTYSYNTRGQLLTVTDPLSHVITCNYDLNGYLLSVDGPLPGTNDATTFTYDSLGRIQTLTDVSGYTTAYDYDNLDRLTRTTFPDSTFDQYSYDRLDCSSILDRAGRSTSFVYDSMRQLSQMTDPLGRITLFDWCRCGDLKSITDPMGRRTSWTTDLQGRRTAKQYNDGSQVNYVYENTVSRLREVRDEQQQTTVYSYNADNTVRSIGNGNALRPTPSVTFTYDPDYLRVATMTDGIGTRNYSYVPVSSPPIPGAGELAGTAGPLNNETTTYSYDSLGRPVQEVMDSAVTTRAYDAAGRVTSISNALGSFVYGYDGSSRRLASQSFPNGLNLALSYGTRLQDFRVQQIAWTAGATPISQFNYGWDVARRRIATWSQQAGVQPPNVASFGYDAAGQLLSGAVTNSGSPVTTYGYNYDPAGNRLSEQVGATVNNRTYNALNQISGGAASGPSYTNEWDAMHRLTAVNVGNQRTEFAYDGQSHLAYIRQLQNGSETSFRRFVWSQSRICEERDKSGGTVTKHFFAQGVKVETGVNAGAYYYTGDHLGSIRELTDAGGTVRARYSYDPWGRRTHVAGDLDTDFGFAGMFWSAEANLSMTHFRAYDPNLGRWLSRDPLNNAEVTEGPNLYAYAANDPVNLTDPLGLEEVDMDSLLQYFESGPSENTVIRQIENIPETSPEEMRALEQYFHENFDMPGGEIEEAGGEVEEVGGEIEEVAGGEIEEVTGGEIRDLTQEEMWEYLADQGHGQIVEVTEEAVENPIPVRVAPAPRTMMYPGFSGALTEFVGAGITILTMTDCNTVNGILGLVRQGKGGALNVYEDRLLKQIDNYP